MPDRPVRRLRVLRGRRRLSDPEGESLSYADAVAALTSRGRFGISLGLERIARVLDDLGNPERALRGALVGGTNGKGSVVAMVAAIVRAAGLSVGTMPKPHLVAYRERIAIDGASLSRADFAAAVARVLPAVDRVAAAVGPPTEFEALTAAAVTELARRELALVIVEVGLGGRLDATNVLDLGVAAITNVQRDHEKHLGHTLRAIGTEKAAIIKRGNLAVTGATGRGVAPIVQRCAALGVPLRRAGARHAYRAEVREVTWSGVVVDARTPTAQLRDLRIGLLGRHQAANAAVALAVADALVEHAAGEGRRVSLGERAVRDGLATVRWPGRLELLDAMHLGAGRVLLDGAHNPAGAAALAAALRELGLRRPSMVFGAMRGKRVADMLRALAPLEPRLVFTRVADPGAHEPDELLRIWRRAVPDGGAARTADTPARALEIGATARARADDPLVVAGSLYLVGAVRGMITGDSDEG